MKEVEFLSIRENSFKEKDDVLRALFNANMPNLVLLDISSCAQFTPDDHANIRAHLPHVLVNTDHSKSKKYQTDTD